jgi:DNA-binding IclR family transcriptional regulator
VHRATVSLLLDVFALARPAGDPLDLLILATVVQANNARVAASADLQLRYATLDDPTPSDLRRPITVNAVANSLGLSFESVRRRMHGLARRGLCRLGPGGAVTPIEALTSPHFEAAATAAYRRLQRHHEVLRGLGALEGLPRPTARLPNSPAPIRAALRIGLQHLLRVSDAGRAAFGDVISCLILFETLRANTEHLGDMPGEDARAGDLLPDASRAPITVVALARRLGLAAETTRRHVLMLQQGDALVRVRGGLIVPAARLAQADVLWFSQENLRHTRRMFSALSSLGVLDHWDRASAPPSP